MVSFFASAQQADTTRFITSKLYTCPVVSPIERLYKFFQQSFRKVCSFTRLWLASRCITYFISLSSVGNNVDCMLRGGICNWINNGDCNVCVGLYMESLQRCYTQWDWDFCAQHQFKTLNLMASPCDWICTNVHSTHI